MAFLWVIFSYLLGSIPFGYLISRFSGKDILEIGWRKTSGSNVFKNVGKWQGLLTGLLDLAKGYLAVYGARQIGLSVEIQIFSGVAAVTGHNWSLFLKFSGGRGIGTFVGAFLTLSPQILFFSIIPLIILALVWNAAIGSLLFLVSAIFISFYLGQFETTGFFTILSLVPILIKRLSPLKEIIEAKNRGNLIGNRLFFDNNEALWDLRIKRIIQKEKNNPSRITKMVKPLAAPLLFPPKMGWKAAKYGAKLAEKPIKFIFKAPEKVITEITTDDFKKMMLLSSKKIVLHQEEINKINVFPVADKDTGYNLAATLLGVEGVISLKNYSTFRELTEDIKEAAMVNARGNAGMIYTGYVIEVLGRIKHLETIDAFHLALAMKRGIKAARFSIAEPVDGTILDVIKTAGDKAFESAKIKREKNIIKVLEEAYKESLVALKETKEKLQVLKENDVVDAGALGFVKILEAWIESLKEIPIAARVEAVAPIEQPESGEWLKFRVKEDKSSSSATELSPRESEGGKEGEALFDFAAARLYEVVLSFKKAEGTELEKIKQELSLLGDSLDIIELGEKIKIHIHTDQPESVQEKFKNLPEFESKIESMASSTPSPRSPLGLVVDEVADLPKEFLEKHNIIEVPFTTRFPDGQIVNSKEEIYQKMKEALKAGRPLPTTSAPSFKEFLSAFQKALEKFERILVITVSSKLSGAYSSARIARSIYKKPTKLDIYVFDCFTAEVGEGLVAIKAQEMISQGKNLEEIKEELKEFCPQIVLLGCLNDFKYAVRGGRFKLPKIFVKPVYFIQKIGIRFIVGLKNGKVRFFRINLGKDISRILAEEVKQQSRGRAIRAAIAHADNPQEAQKLKEELEKLAKVEIAFVAPVSPVVATHTGPGALLVAFHFIDE